MSQSASQAAIFYQDVEKNKILFTIKDDKGYPAPMTSSGKRSMPFWSSKSRVEKIIKNVPAYNDFKPIEITLKEFYGYWLNELEKDDQLVGINWSGKNAVGYDLEPRYIKEWLDTRLPELQPTKRTVIGRLKKWLKH